MFTEIRYVLPPLFFFFFFFFLFFNVQKYLLFYFYALAYTLFPVSKRWEVYKGMSQGFLDGVTGGVSPFLS